MEIEELQFIFTSPTFTTNEVAKEYRELFIIAEKLLVEFMTIGF
ncbi:TPA: hypothetical protein ACGOWE_000461 [Streptococcus suis]